MILQSIDLQMLGIFSSLASAIDTYKSSGVNPL